MNSLVVAIVDGALIGMLVDDCLNLGLHLCLEGQGRGDSLLTGASSRLVDSTLPFLVLFLVDFELNREVANVGRDQVPINPFQIAALVHLADRDGKEEGDQHTSCHY